MNFEGFKQLVSISRMDLYRETLAENRGSIRVKKEKTVMKNLERILDATLRISNEKGFQAMSMRDLGMEAGLSMGALYSYFASKDELLEMLQKRGRTVSTRILNDCTDTKTLPSQKLSTFIKTYLYLCEVMHPWFYFSYMETRNLSKQEREKALISETNLEKNIADILILGQEKGEFHICNSQLTAGIINCMIQDWYLKRWRFKKDGVSVDQYAEFLLDFIQSFCIQEKTT